MKVHSKGNSVFFVALLSHILLLVFIYHLKAKAFAKAKKFKKRKS